MMENLCCKISFILIFSSLCIYSVGQSGSDKDNVKFIEVLFQNLQSNPSKLKLQKIVDGDSDVYAAFDQIIWGDLDNDNLQDALLPFWVGVRDGGHLSDVYYGVFINKNGKFEYDFSYHTGTAGTYLDWPLTVFEKIEGGKIFGREANREDVYRDYPYWVYQYIKGNIETLHVPLHPTLGGEYELKPVEYLKPLFVKMPDGELLDIEPSVEILKRYFGKKFKIKLYTAPVCDGMFRLDYSDNFRGEAFYGELPFAQFEINDNKKAAWNFIDFTETDAVLITEQGYIDKHTTIKDFKKAFPETCKSNCETAKGVIIIRIYTTEDEELLNGIRESAWEISFDSRGEIQWVKYWGAC